MSSEEDLKRQIQALESALSKYKSNSNRQQPYNRYNPIRPSPAQLRSRNMKLVVKGEEATQEKYIRTRNTLTKVGVADNKRHIVRTAPQKQVVIDGEQYVYKGRGNKLVRASAPTSLPAKKQQLLQRKSSCVVNIDGIDYVRTKKGSLVRVDALRTLGERPPQPVRKLARKRMCTKYMFGRCEKADDECKYSHKPTPETVPVCVHFQRGSCTNPDCLFVHVTMNPNAPICRNFIYNGFCARGSKCPHRHVWECPDWVEKGKCARPKCRLPHPAPKSQEKAKQTAADKVEDERAVQRYIQRPVFGKQHDDETDYSSGSDLSDHSDDSLDGDVSNDEAEELLKWYDDTYTEPTQADDNP